jgi:hypothetical protein
MGGKLGLKIHDSFGGVEKQLVVNRVNRMRGTPGQGEPGC